MKLFKVSTLFRNKKIKEAFRRVNVSNRDGLFSINFNSKDDAEYVLSQIKSSKIMNTDEFILYLKIVDLGEIQYFLLTLPQYQNLQKYLSLLGVELSISMDTESAHSNSESNSNKGLKERSGILDNFNARESSKISDSDKSSKFSGGSGARVTGYCSRREPRDTAPEQGTQGGFPRDQNAEMSNIEDKAIRVQLIISFETAFWSSYQENLSFFSRTFSRFGASNNNVPGIKDIIAHVASTVECQSYGRVRSAFMTLMGSPTGRRTRESLRIVLGYKQEDETMINTNLPNFTLNYVLSVYAKKCQEHGKLL